MLLFCLIITVSMSSKSLDEIMTKYAKAPNADNVNIGKFGWNFIKLSSTGNKDLAIVKKINSLHVLDIEDCTPEIKQEFQNDFRNCSIDGYEVLMKVKDDEDDVLILSKSKKDTIKEFVIVSINDGAIVKIKGNFKASDLTDIQKQYGPESKKSKDKK